MTTAEIIAQIARQHGTTPAEVEKEMLDAIRKAMASPDPRAREMWRQIAPDGKTPSVDRFLEYCTGQIRKRMGQ